MGLTVACLDVWADAVRQEVQRVAPPDWTLRFAQSYESAHQQAVAADADALLPGFAPVDEALLAAAPRVRWVHKWGIGIDSIDLAALRRRGIGLAITTGANSQPVAEMALALILAVNRRIPYVNRVMRLGQWPTPEMRMGSAPQRATASSSVMKLPRCLLIFSPSTRMCPLQKKARGMRAGSAPAQTAAWL
jgi:D-3-phosphoglycerate dehydrogenase